MRRTSGWSCAWARRRSWMASSTPGGGAGRLGHDRIGCGQTPPDVAQDWRDTSVASLADLHFDRLEVRPITNGFEVVRPPSNQLWQMTRPIPMRANNAKIEALLQQLDLARVAASSRMTRSPIWSPSDCSPGAGTGLRPGDERPTRPPTRSQSHQRADHRFCATPGQFQRPCWSCGAVLDPWLGDFASSATDACVIFDRPP